MLNLLPVIVIRSLNEEIAQKQVKNFKVHGQFEKINLQVPVKQFFVLIVATSSAELDLFERDEIQLRTECM